MQSSTTRVVKFLPKDDGIVNLGSKVDNLPYRIITFKTAEDSCTMEWAPRSDPGMIPEENNLYTYNPIVGINQLTLRPGKDKNIVEVKANRRSIPTFVEDANLNVRELMVNEWEEVKSGERIKIGRSPIIRDKKVVAVPPVYEVHTPVEDFLAPVGIGSDEQ